MDPFKDSFLEKEKLNAVGSLAQTMKVLGEGNGHKKDASVAKIKDVNLQEKIMRRADTVEQEIKQLFPDVSILVVSEVARRLRKEYEAIAREQIPAVLTDANMSSITLLTGEKLTVSDRIEANISDKNYMLARDNMVQQAIADGETSEQAIRRIDNLFKKNIVIEEPTEELKAKLLDMDVLYDNKYSIHWQTLRKYCKEQRNKGRDIPEGISVFEYSEATLK